MPNGVSERPNVLSVEVKRLWWRDLEKDEGGSENRQRTSPRVEVGRFGGVMQNDAHANEESRHPRGRRPRPTDGTERGTPRRSSGEASSVEEPLTRWSGSWQDRSGTCDRPVDVEVDDDAVEVTSALAC